jgi:phenylalanyl-tRNA synthetase beta chain
VDKIPATPPRGARGAHAADSVHDQLAEARRILTGLGLQEAQGQTLISGQEFKFDTAGTIALANPLSSDMDVLRPTLLPGLIHSLGRNVSRKNPDLAFFEIGRVFVNAVPDGAAESRPEPGEERHVAIAMTGLRHPLFWGGEGRGAKYDIYDLKGVLDEFAEQFGLRGVGYTRRDPSTALFLESAAIRIVKDAVGELGQLLPALAKRYDLRDPVFLAELNLDKLLSWRVPGKSFKPLPPFPSVRRDVAMIVAEETTHEAVLRAVKQAKAPNLEAVEVFDIFRGSNVPAGHKSLAYAFTYRNAERTLTDAEVNASHEKVLAAFKKELKAALRE